MTGGPALDSSTRLGRVGESNGWARSLQERWVARESEIFHSFAGVLELDSNLTVRHALNAIYQGEALLWGVHFGS